MSDYIKNMKQRADDSGYFVVEECENCKRFSKEEMKQRNHLYCLLKCEPYGRACLSAAFAYNEAMFGDPNIYGLDGTVWKPEDYGIGEVKHELGTNIIHWKSGGGGHANRKTDSP